MSTLLHIDSSARSGGSISRQLTASFVSQWQAKNPGGKVVHRDLAANALPHLSESMLGAYFTPADARSAEQAEVIKQSDALVDELLAADTIVIGVPMYNFAPPSTLKAWIDHVFRAGRTFKYTETGPVGLVTGKKAVIILSRGGMYSEGPMEALDFQGKYLKSALGFIGITDVELVVAEGVSMGEEAAKQAVASAEAKINASV
ncbi:FMN-dependent NADH-azoreductase [Herbaspirillum seropedicae]|uniref:FMN dependent NADH:quinone oxidoreductase n=1 Tax=Herbaspirillum seropedicae (strain SmR1) TaxID=757424 RepID=D8IT67_HERSS|nr:FMN-dependent NADH-azoreductase [Herbaspirillum seropedicae]ADJ63626.1 acyl-carrier-protein phosphodiesterase protein [Herbaspirillum seropedicae SmR1]AKN65651.1 FMN-dependent NADH-azoreductase [Herbaspirillum seropedicae]AON54452.1 acyl-carrier-protein phosphodiesterase [Herbaspirillum seropedicae]MDR6394501.1 FMN-dependent NADH-azoreductase [Herbaspirillum seropedicae]NQE28810.1 FMN-dependent NADH-azoreductase [Herbaspirillum seropedicae]